MPADSIDVHYVAQLARLHLTEEEEERLTRELGQILQYVEKLKELDVSGVEPMAHAAPRSNVTRPDEVRDSLLHEDAMRNAPSVSDRLFMMPRIIE